MILFDFASKQQKNYNFVHKNNDDALRISDALPPR